MRHRLRGIGEGELAVVTDLDLAQVPAAVALDGLVHRQRVEEFVGDDDGGAVRHFVEARVPLHRHAQRLERFLLVADEDRIDLHQVQRHGMAERRQTLIARMASTIMVPRPGPSSMTRKAIRRAHLLPHRAHPQADQFAEHLADLRRGDEVAGTPERIARGVIAVRAVGEAQPHVFADRHGTGGMNAPANFDFQRRLLVHHNVSCAYTGATPSVRSRASGNPGRQAAALCGRDPGFPLARERTEIGAML